MQSADIWSALAFKYNHSLWNDNILLQLFRNKRQLNGYGRKWIVSPHYQMKKKSEHIFLFKSCVPVVPKFPVLRRVKDWRYTGNRLVQWPNPRSCICLRVVVWGFPSVGAKEPVFPSTHSLSLQRLVDLILSLSARWYSVNLSWQKWIKLVSLNTAVIH